MDALDDEKEEAEQQKLTLDLPPIQSNRARSIVSPPAPIPLTWGEIIDVLDVELEEKNKHKEQKKKLRRSKRRWRKLKTL